MSEQGHLRKHERLRALLDHGRMAMGSMRSYCHAQAEGCYGTDMVSFGPTCSHKLQTAWSLRVCVVREPTGRGLPSERQVAPSKAISAHSQKATPTDLAASGHGGSGRKCWISEITKVQMKCQSVAVLGTFVEEATELEFSVSKVLRYYATHCSVNVACDNPCRQFEAGLRSVYKTR